MGTVTDQEWPVAVVTFTTVRAADFDTAAGIAVGTVRKALADADGVNPGELPAPVRLTIRQGDQILALETTVHAVAELGRAAAAGVLTVRPTGDAYRDPG